MRRVTTYSPVLLNASSISLLIRRQPDERLFGRIPANHPASARPWPSFQQAPLGRPVDADPSSRKLVAHPARGKIDRRLPVAVRAKIDGTRARVPEVEA